VIKSIYTNTIHLEIDVDVRLLVSFVLLLSGIIAERWRLAPFTATGRHGLALDHDE
jgi:hypothetical protein